MLEQGAIFLSERQKDSRIHYEAGLAPSCSPAAQIPYGMHRTAEGAGENATFPPHPPNTARHLPLKGKALLVRPICLHNFSLHNFVYATIKRIPYPSQYAVLFYIFIHFVKKRYKLMHHAVCIFFRIRIRNHQIKNEISLFIFF